MNKFLAVFFVLSISVQASPHLLSKFLEVEQASFTPTDALSIAQGILEGLQENTNAPGHCYTDMSTTVTNAEKIVTDVKSIIAGNTSAWATFGTDVKTLLDQLKSFEPDCNFSGLIAKIESFATPTGVVVLLKNFFENMSTIVADALSLKTCASNYKGCGVNIGSILRLMTGWNLNETDNLETYQGNFEDFLAGLMNGLSGGQNNQCTTDVVTLSSQVDTLIADFKKLLRGDILVISQIYTLAKEIAGAMDSFAPDCNVAALETALESLGTVDGWYKVLKNYVANEATVNASLKGIETCSSNYAGCGTDLGTVISVLLGWTI